MDTSILVLLLLAVGWGIIMTIILAWQIKGDEPREAPGEKDRSPVPPPSAANAEGAPRKLAG